MFVTIATPIYGKGKNEINGMFPLYNQAEERMVTSISNGESSSNKLALH